MADLMTGTFEFQKLESQYKNFRAPAVSFSRCFEPGLLLSQSSSRSKSPRGNPS